MNHKTNTLSIRTPEGIHFPLILASPVIRFLAWVVDIFCIMAMVNLVGALIGIFGIISWDIASALSILVYFIISIGYGIAMEFYWRGQTLGKRILKIRVIKSIQAIYQQLLCR